MQRYRNRKWIAATATLTALSLISASAYVRAQATAQPLTKSLPAWTKVVVRLDWSEENESARFLRSVATGDKVEGVRNLVLGLLQMGLQHLGTPLDIERDVLGWMGKEAIVAVDPPAKGGEKERVLLLASVTDQGAATEFLNKFTSALKAKMPNEVTSETAGGVTVWTISHGNDKTNFALGPNALGLSPSAETLREWLAGKSDESVVARTEASFAKTRSSLIAYYVDQNLINRADVLPPDNPAQQFFKIRSVGGGLAINSRGIQLETTVSVNEGSGLTKLAQSIPAPTAKALGAIPADVLALATVAQPNGFLNGLPLPADPVAIIASIGGQALNNFPADVIGGLIKSEPVAALTSIGKQPGVLVSIAVESEQIAQRAFKALHDTLMTVQEIRITAENIGDRAVDKIEVIGQSEAPAIYLTQSGSFVLAATSKETLLKSFEVIGGKIPSIGNSPEYRKVADRVAGKPLLGIFANPSGLIQQAVTAVSQESGARNVYLERAAQLLSRGLTSLAFNASVEPDAARLVVSAGLDYPMLQAKVARLSGSTAAE